MNHTLSTFQSILTNWNNESVPYTFRSRIAPTTEDQSYPPCVAVEWFVAHEQNCSHCAWWKAEVRYQKSSRAWVFAYFVEKLFKYFTFLGLVVLLVYCISKAYFIDPIDSNSKKFCCRIQVYLFQLFTLSPFRYVGCSNKWLNEESVWIKLTGPTKQKNRCRHRNNVKKKNKSYLWWWG